MTTRRCWKRCSGVWSRCGSSPITCIKPILPRHGALSHPGSHPGSASFARCAAASQGSVSRLMCSTYPAVTGRCRSVLVRPVEWAHLAIGSSKTVPVFGTLIRLIPAKRRVDEASGGGAGRSCHDRRRRRCDCTEHGPGALRAARASRGRLIRISENFWRGVCSSISCHTAGVSYRAGNAGAQATAQSERIRPGLVANRFHAVSQASMMSARVRNTELASQWLRR